MATRSIYLLGLITVVLLLFISMWLQYMDDFVPCPLCTLQRLTFGLFGILFFIGIFVHNRKIGRITINFLSLCAAFLGILLAGRQVWLQYFSTGNNIECGVSIQYMLQILSFKEVAQKILAGSAECTQQGWKFLSLNMAEWSLIWFILLFILAGYLLKKR